MYQPVDIVLIEDNPADVELATHALTQEGMVKNRLKVLRDGAEALDFLYGRGAFTGRDLIKPPRLILLDLKLPKLNGIEVLRVIKADPKTRMIPVVMLTASGEDSDLSECYRLGVNGYIVKPVDFDEFVDAMAATALYWLQLNQPPTA